jgi:IS5 family transposase
MKQQTPTAAADRGGGFEQYRRATKRDVFLATMNEIVPWQALCEVIEPHYAKAGNGRSPVGLERMLRMYFMQHRFRRLLERHQRGEQPFATVGQVLQARGLKVGTGTIVNAAIIGAPSSTKSADKARDPEMRQSRKGKQWSFGMKKHIGVGSCTCLVHSAVVTAATRGPSWSIATTATTSPDLRRRSPLRQFCGFSSDQAYRYWVRKAAPGVNFSAMQSRIARFTPPPRA